MAEIRPFSAYRPAPGMESKIAALPYDVYNREEAAEEVKRSPDSFLAIDRAETGFGPEVGTYAAEVYERAAKLLRDWTAGGKFIKEEYPCYYLYELTMGGRSQTGIVACAAIDDYCNNVIKKHENTRRDKEQDRIRHVDVCNMQTGPIFLAYRSNAILRSLVSEAKGAAPVYDFISDDGIRHRVWVIREPERIGGIRRQFAGLDAIYIADGHHRCASAVKVGLMRREAHPDYTGEEEYNYFLSVLFPDDELYIMDYNRVVQGLNGYSKEAFLVKVSEHFQVEEAAKSPCRPEKKGTFGMFLDGTWYRLAARPHILSEDVVGGLDVSLLQDWLLGPVLGIKDPKTDNRIGFVGGIRGLEELERRVRAEQELPAGWCISPGEVGSAGQGSCGGEGFPAGRCISPGEVGSAGQGSCTGEGFPAGEAPRAGQGLPMGQALSIQACPAQGSPSGSLAVAFSMYPTSIGELFAVADAGKLMPPKSTWFEPKLRSGLFLHALE